LFWVKLKCFTKFNRRKVYILLFFHPIKCSRNSREKLLKTYHFVKEYPALFRYIFSSSSFISDKFSHHRVCMLERNHILLLFLPLICKQISIRNPISISLSLSLAKGKSLYFESLDAAKAIFYFDQNRWSGFGWKERWGSVLQMMQKYFVSYC
jgi:hypothetical protein